MIDVTPRAIIAYARRHPYDGDRPEDGWAHAAARAIAADLLDRIGISGEMEDIDEETRRGIVNTHAAIIRAAFLE